MTREEKQKAIDTLKISAPIMAVTQEEFNDYIQTLNEVMDWLEQQPCEDCISRKSIKQKLQEQHDFYVNAYGGFSNLSQNGKSRVYEITNCISMVVNEPPVTPKQKTGHCRDCKWWKDSDGVYRRGVGAESQCPINCREVYEGNGYCFRFNPQESEE